MSLCSYSVFHVRLAMKLFFFICNKKKTNLFPNVSCAFLPEKSQLSLYAVSVYCLFALLCHNMNEPLKLFFLLFLYFCFDAQNSHSERERMNEWMEKKYASLHAYGCNAHFIFGLVASLSQFPKTAQIEIEFETNYRRDKSCFSNWILMWSWNIWLSILWLIELRFQLMV